MDLAEQLFDDAGMSTASPTEFSWDDKTAGAMILLLNLTGDAKYEEAVDRCDDKI